MSVNASITAYRTAMNPFAGKAQLVAPAMTNAVAPSGLTYLSHFLGNCSDCIIDALNVHWYSNKYAGATYFQTFINQTRAVRDMYPQTKGKPIWVTEFGLTNDCGDPVCDYSDADLQSFLMQVMPWMDSQPDVGKYAYFMNAPGILLNAAGDALSGAGVAYNNYTTSVVMVT